MNSQTQKATRLLQLYPVEALAQAGGRKDRKELMIAALLKRGVADVFAFAKDYFYRTRQHIYCFENETGKVPAKAQFLDNVWCEQTRGKDVVDFYLVEDSVEYFVEHPDKTVTQEEVKLWWPIQVNITNKVIIVRCTVLERDVSSAIQGAKVISPGRRSRDDKDLLTEFFTSGFGQAKFFPPLDLNKGIKELWHQDVIDALAVRFKKARSTSEEAMDESFLLKKTDPALYGQLILSPLQNCTFLCLKDRDTLVYGFQCSPSDGILRFYRYTKGTESTDNVLRKILQLN